MMNEPDITRAELRISFAKDVKIHLPDAPYTTKLLSVINPSFLIFSWYGFKEEIYKGKPIGKRAQVIDDGNEVLIYDIDSDAAISNKEKYEKFKTDDFVCLTRLELMIRSQLEYFERTNPKVKYLNWFELSTDKLGDYATYNPWTDELKTHLDRFEE